MQTENGQLLEKVRPELPNFLDSIPTLVAYVDRDLRYQHVNAASRHWIGKPMDEIIGHKVYEVHGPEIFLDVKRYIEQALAGEITQFEYTVRRKDGVRHIEVCYIPDFDENNAAKGYVVHIYDVTEKKKNERGFRDHMENAPVGLHWVNADGIILWANRADMELLGYTQDEYVGRHISEFHVDQSIISDMLRRLSANETLHQYEAKLRHKDGSIRHVVINTNVLWEDDKFVHTRCFTFDITQKKLAEEKLAASQIYFQEIMDLFPMAFYSCDENGYVRYYNDAAIELWGRKPEIGKDRWCGSWQAYELDGTPMSMDEYPMALAYQNKHSQSVREIIIERPDGTKRIVRPYPKPTIDRDGKLTGAINAMVDITQQREAEIALHESELLYKQLVDSLPVAIYTCDAKGIILKYNQAAADLWGREPEIGKDMWCGSWKIFTPAGSTLPPEDCPMAVALKEKRPVLGEEIVVERPDGQQRYINPNPYPLFSKSGELVGAVNMLLDITEQKRSLNALKESEELFRTLASQTPVVIWMTDDSGSCMYVNSKWTDLTGLPVAKAVGEGWLNYIHPDDRTKAIRELFAALSEKNLYHSKFRHQAKHDEYIIVKSFGTPRFSPDGKFLGYVGILQDVTLQENTKAALEKEIKARTYDLLIKNEELRKSEERYHRMVSEVQDYAIILLNKDGIIENWNTGAEKIKGYTAKDAIGKSFKMFYAKQDRERNLPDMLIATAAREGRATHEGWRVRKDGTLFWGSVVLTALHDDSNGVIGFSKVTRDLTERKSAEDALRLTASKLEEKNRELEKMNQELASFAYVSSHDLQEPLRKIQTFANRILDLEQNGLSEKGKDYFNRIQNSANRMRSLIEDLLTYSRANTAERKYVDTDLNKLLEEAKAELKERIEESGAQVISSELPVMKVIPFQFHQLVLNLLANSLKFTRPGVTPEIKISASIESGKNIASSLAFKAQDYHHLSFSDNGIGFEPAYNTKIFEIFQRLHNRDAYAGTGVGLAICKKIVENHQGIILAEGRVNEGTTIHVYLPVKEVMFSDQ